MTRTLIVLAHPAIQISRVNRAMAGAAKRTEGVTLHDLYSAYPNFYIDAKREQARLLEYDAIVLQHPLYWYHMPALLKDWVDLVLEYGWAYGGGTALVGKSWTHAFSTGSPATAYTEAGTHRHGTDTYSAGFEQTAAICGMHWHAPFITHDARKFDDDALDARLDEYQAWLRSLAASVTPPVLAADPAA
ncbi:NAD(P)H-dependent oxidoreductase [soil metagenome]